MTFTPTWKCRIGPMALRHVISRMKEYQMAPRAFLGVLLLGMAAVGVAGMSSPAHAGSLFHNLPPCILFDTRVAGGAMAAFETRTFHVVGAASNFAAQGG